MHVFIYQLITLINCIPYKYIDELLTCYESMFKYNYECKYIDVIYVATCIYIRMHRHIIRNTLTNSTSTTTTTTATTTSTTTTTTIHSPPTQVPLQEGLLKYPPSSNDDPEHTACAQSPKTKTHFQYVRHPLEVRPIYKYMSECMYECMSGCMHV
jgi:hypothetical protein